MLRAIALGVALLAMAGSAHAQEPTSLEKLRNMGWIGAAGDEGLWDGRGLSQDVFIRIMAELGVGGGTEPPEWQSYSFDPNALRLSDDPEFSQFLSELTRTEIARQTEGYDELARYMFMVSQNSGVDGATQNRALAAAFQAQTGMDDETFAQHFPHLAASLQGNGDTASGAESDPEDGEQAGGSVSDRVHDSIIRLKDDIDAEADAAREAMQREMEQARDAARARADQIAEETRRQQEAIETARRTEEAARQQREMLARQQAEARDQARQLLQDRMDQNTQDLAERYMERRVRSEWPAWITADSRYRYLLASPSTSVTDFRAYYEGEAHVADGDGNTFSGEFEAELFTTDSDEQRFSGLVFGLRFESDDLRNDGVFSAQVFKEESSVLEGVYSGRLTGNFYGPQAQALGGKVQLTGLDGPDLNGHFAGVASE